MHIITLASCIYIGAGNPKIKEKSGLAMQDYTKWCSNIVGPPNVLFAPTKKIQHYPLTKHYCSCVLYNLKLLGGGGGYSPHYSNPRPHILTVVVESCMYKTSQIVSPPKPFGPNKRHYHPAFRHMFDKVNAAKIVLTQTNESRDQRRCRLKMPIRGETTSVLK